MRERVSAYVDGEASEVEQVAVARHLEGCLDCREFVAFTRRAQRILQEGEHLRSSRPVSAPGLSVVARRSRRRSSRLSRAALGFAAALMIGAFIGAVGTHAALHETDTVSPAALYRAKIAPGMPLDPDFARYFETAPRPAMVIPEIYVIEDPVPPDPAFRWAGLEPEETYHPDIPVELVSY
jgi:hypothetical protein